MEEGQTTYPHSLLHGYRSRVQKNCGGRGEVALVLKRSTQTLVLKVPPQLLSVLTL